MKISESVSRRRHSGGGAAGFLSHDGPRTAYWTFGFSWIPVFCYHPFFRRFMLSATRRKSTLCLVFFILLICGPYLLYYLLNTEMGRQSNDIVLTTSFSSYIEPAPNGYTIRRDRSHPENDADDIFAYYDPDKTALDSFNRRLEELNRIRISLLNELRTLEEKRSHMRTEIDALMVQSDRLQTELRQGVKDLEQIRISIEQANLIRKEVAERNTPEISLPKALFPPPFATDNGSDRQTVSSSICSMSTCFDYSRCSITTGFPVYVYKSSGTVSKNAFDLDLVRLFSESVYAVSDPTSACVFVVLLNKGVELDADLIRSALPYWHRAGDGANHVVFNGRNPVGRSILVSDAFPNDSSHFRFGYDVLMPRLGENEEGKSLLNAPPIVPIRRRYFLSVLSCPTLGNAASGDAAFVANEFNQILHSKTAGLVYFAPMCQPNFTSENTTTNTVRNEKNATDVLALSTFTLIVIQQSDWNRLPLLMTALEQGAVPVLLTDSPLPPYTFLPLGETLDWRLASIQLPLARLPEVQFYLRGISDSDLARLRRHGGLFYQAYFSTKGRVAESVLATLRHRLNIPSAPAKETESQTYFNETYHPKFGDVAPKTSDGNTIADVDEYLGPVEAPNPSPRYQQNFSLVTMYSYELWNVYADPFRMYPQFPFTENALPSEAKFIGSPFGFRPINDGAGGSGKEFSESLGGNYPREQFTVVLLTYEREQVLIAALNRLNNLPYLNKVIVVWNGPTPPNADTVWPKIAAPIVVIKPEKNSLNNRFLPYREIETEAVLSIDDDVHLRRDEIIFGFRVWREARDRIVGFPARYHAWNANSLDWAYNSNHSCELSMVLTGAAFLHKYYFYVYSYSMPAVIREKVDELMNCEDIAMNFLVSHMTKKPPLKVTSRWTFRCPGCPETLSADETHFLERHDCLNYFTRIYGYNSLLYTQFRVDSILFKMRIPQNHQKCFKFI